MNTDDFRLLERLTIISPLGIRFRDAVSGAVVDEGLSVSAYSPTNTSRRVEAFANRKGVYVFHDLPGLRGVEYPAGDEDPLNDLRGKWPFVLEVTDVRNRFIPFILKVDVPTKGLYRWESETVLSPPSQESPVILYPAPTRPVPSPMAAVRAELWDPLLGRPASWTVVEAVIEGVVQGRGISDELGRLLVMFPYPEPKDFPSSPPHPAPLRIFDRTWTLQLRAFYSPDPDVPAIPELKKVFEQQPAALWSSVSPAIPLGHQTLKYGSELVLASESESELLITPTSSP